MIRSFRCQETQKLFERRKPSRKFPPDIQERARLKLSMIHAAHEIDDLRTPPSNHLKALGGDREGEYSVRVNHQWRICFRWESGNAFDVEMNNHYD